MKLLAALSFKSSSIFLHLPSSLLTPDLPAGRLLRLQSLLSPLTDGISFELSQEGDDSLDNVRRNVVLTLDRQFCLMAIGRTFFLV